MSNVENQFNAIGTIQTVDDPRRPANKIKN